MDNLPGALTLRSHVMAKMLAISTVKKLNKITCRVAFAALVIALLACSGEATATPVPTHAPTPVPTATVEPTAVPTPVPTPTAESTPAPGDKNAEFTDYWKPPTDFYGKPVYGGTLRIADFDPLEHANIWGAATWPTLAYRAPTGAGLVMEDPYDPYAPVIPDLAKSWTIHEDGDGVTFRFREGTKWQKGVLFTCEDARFSLDTMATGEGLTASYMQGRLTNVVLEELACLDDMTLQVNLTEPTAIPLLPFSHPYAPIFNKVWFLKGGEEAMFQDVSMGIGPFKWAEGQRVGIDVQRFEKNPDYFTPEVPYVDELIIHGILDERTRQAVQLAHQTDWTWVYFRPVPTYNYSTSGRYMYWGEYQAYVDHEQIMTVTRPMMQSFTLWINAQRAPFDNVRVRQAIVMGIDRNAAVQALREGHATIGGLGYPPGSPWELPREQRCSVPGWCVPDDMEATRAEARAILEQEGFDFRKTYEITAEKDFASIAGYDLLIEQLQLLGIKAEKEFIHSINYWPGQGLIWEDFRTLNSTVIADDPTAGMALFLRCDSVQNYWYPDGPCDKSLEALLDQAAVETDPEKRLELSHQIELAAIGRYSPVPLYWEHEAVAFWPEVRGYVHFPHRRGSYQKFMHMWIDPARADDSGNAGQTNGVPGGI